MKTVNHPADTVQLQEREKNFPLAKSADLDPLMERIGDAHFALLGEASHGTHEYYTWRTAITKRLIQEKGFRFIAVEGDWPDCYRVNRYIKGYEFQDKDAKDVLKMFDRWPTWMWANWEIVALVNWLKEYNAAQPPELKVGFYGLDVYSLWESMDTMISYLDKADPDAAVLARDAVRCFDSHGSDEHDYARSVFEVPETCREEVVRLLKDVRKKSITYNDDPEATLNMEQNAHIVVNAEAYYRHMIAFNDRTWNMRDTHMVDTLRRVCKFHGEDAKAIVWEHNTHIGDARFTDMKKAGMVNVGQLVREEFGDEDAVLVGFGSYEGSVMAGKRWGAPMQEMELPAARRLSAEAILHEDGGGDRLLIFDNTNLNERFGGEVLHRAVGVVYDPLREKFGNYVPSVLNSRYDAFLFIDETTALHPLHVTPDEHKVPETYPFEY
jgi:erythromycin esterase